MATDQAALALKRFGLGARPGDLDRISADPRGAVLAEIDTRDIALLDSDDLTDAPAGFLDIRRDQEARKLIRLDAAAPDPKAAKPVAPAAANVVKPNGAGALAMAGGMGAANDMAGGGMSGGGMSGGGMAAGAMGGNAMAGGNAMGGGAMAGGMSGPGPAAKKLGPNAAQGLYMEEIAARLDRTRQAEIGFVERLVAFWANHFAVQADKDELVRGLAGAFERDAIRPFVLGRFEDMLVAATQHPAMLMSLDNAGSVGPDSPVGKKQDRGLNENHARELLELHTVGVDAGYTQADVTSFARILTGWTFGRDMHKPDGGMFGFQNYLHEPGDHALMGKVYKEDAAYPIGNEGQGLAALHDLAHHPATARHIAGKFAAHFVSDTPPQALVDRLAASFSKTGGDLKALARTLVQSDESWAGSGKFVTPYEFIAASIRALDLNLEPQRYAQMLNLLGQPLWNPSSPQGFHDDKATWLAPDAMTTRLDIADRFGAMMQKTVDPNQLVEAVLSSAASDETRTAVRRAESRPQAIALLLMSPEFQWR